MSTPSDQPPPSAPKSPLSGANLPSAPTPAPAPSVSPAGSGLSKPAFKVTRSPFSPKITGAAAGSSGGPMAIGTASALGASSPSAATARPPVRKRVSATGDFTAQESSGLVLLDFIAAAIAVAAAVMMALAYFKQ
ncbi:MAG TPA: hypothetical protein VHH73_08660 [Verrucomicrobiae bacterium]|nr:hypothetical protein [Verrucomicrobiae bacterium]